MDDLGGVVGRVRDARELRHPLPDGSRGIFRRGRVHAIMGSVVVAKQEMRCVERADLGPRRDQQPPRTHSPLDPERCVAETQGIANGHGDGVHGRGGVRGRLRVHDMAVHAPPYRGTVHAPRPEWGWIDMEMERFRANGRIVRIFPGDDVDDRVRVHAQIGRQRYRGVVRGFVRRQLRSVPQIVGRRRDVVLVRGVHAVVVRVFTALKKVV